MPLSKSDFAECDWQQVIEQCEQKACHIYSRLFLGEAGKAEAAANAKAQEVFTLLGGITSLIFKLDNKQLPLGRRSSGMMVIVVSVLPLNMVDNSISPLRTHFGLIFSLFDCTIGYFILSVHAPEPAFTFTKPPTAISRASCHFIHAHIVKHGTGGRG